MKTHKVRVYTTTVTSTIVEVEYEETNLVCPYEYELFLRRAEEEVNKMNLPLVHDQLVDCRNRIEIYHD